MSVSNTVLTCVFYEEKITSNDIIKRLNKMGYSASIHNDSLDTSDSFNKPIKLFGETANGFYE